MSIKYLNDAFALPIATAKKGVLLSLADRADKYGRCHPGIDDICLRSGYKKRSVINAIIELEKLGFLVVSREHGRCNKYQLVEEKLSTTSASSALLSNITTRASDTKTSASNAPTRASDTKTSASNAPKPLEPPINHITKKNKKKDAHSQKSIISENENKKKTPTQKQLLKDLKINDELIDDFITHRKALKAPITKTVLKGFIREADKAGISVSDAIRISVEKGWRAFNHSWNWNDTNQNSSNGKMNRREHGAMISAGIKRQHNQAVSEILSQQLRESSESEQQKEIDITDLGDDVLF